MREWGDSIEYVGDIEAKLSLPMGSHTFDIEALLLILPTTEYQKNVHVAIGTKITDMAVDYIGHNSPENLSKSLKVVCKPPNLDDWCRHSQFKNVLSKQPSQVDCHPFYH